MLPVLSRPSIFKRGVLVLGVAWIGSLLALENVAHAGENDSWKSGNAGPERKIAGKEIPDKGAGDPAILVRKLLGAEVRTATRLALKPYRPGMRGGVVIVVSHREGPLAGAGFEADDLIVEVEGRSIEGLRDFADQIVRLRGKPSILMLGLDHRTGRAGYVQVEIPCEE